MPAPGLITSLGRPRLKPRHGANARPHRTVCPSPRQAASQYDQVLGSRGMTPRASREPHMAARYGVSSGDRHQRGPAVPPWRSRPKLRPSRPPAWRHAGRDTKRPDTVLSSIRRLYHASTVLYHHGRRSWSRTRSRGIQYGRRGTPTSEALEQALAAIEVRWVPPAVALCCRRGWPPISTALLSVAWRLAITFWSVDSVYRPDPQFLRWTCSSSHGRGDDLLRSD